MCQLHQSSACSTRGFHANSRVDPSRTAGLVLRYERDLVNRFRKLAQEMRKLVLSGAFGTEVKTNAPVADFGQWLDRMVKSGILEVTRVVGSDPADRNWQNVYVKAAYTKGMASAANEVKRSGAKVSPDYVEAAFRRPFHADKVRAAYETAFYDLQGVTSAMSSKMSSTLAKGLATGKSSKLIAKELSAVVSQIGITRARLIARTTVVSANAEAALNTYQEAGLRGVGVQSEFSSIDDNKRCPKCSALEGRVYSIKDARGVIPVHPNCRCRWVPKVADGSGKELS